MLNPWIVQKLLHQPPVGALVQERAKVQHDGLEAEVVESTGPWMLTDALKEYLPIRGSRSAGEYVHGSMNTKNGQGPAAGLNTVLLPELSLLVVHGKSR